MIEKSLTCIVEHVIIKALELIKDADKQVIVNRDFIYYSSD